MTANSFTSVSLDPLLVLVCIERDSRFHDAMSQTDSWGVSILTRSAEATARWLATKGRPLENQLAAGRALLRADYWSRVDCGFIGHLGVRTVATYPAGDHDVVRW